MSEHIANTIHDSSNDLIARIMERLPPAEGTSEQDTHQFIAGYVHMMEAAARGNFELREQYWEGVIPAIKAGGMPLEPVMTGMVWLSMGIAAFYSTDEEVREWAMGFCAEHSAQLARVYSQ
jgi:hypothetical protein